MKESPADLILEIDKQQKLINEQRPFSTKELSQIREYYKIGLTYTSNALEGNSLTESETKIIIEEGLTIGGKPLKEHYEALGHAAAYDWMLHLSKKKTVTEGDIKKLHKLFYGKIDPVEAGRYRSVRVFVSGTSYR